MQPLQLPLFSDRLAAGAERITRAALYDATDGSRRDELGVYLELISSLRGSVLELGAGTGRLLAPLLAKGIDVIGLERDPDALVVGWRKLAALGGSRFSRRLIEGDLLAFRLERRFSHVVLGSNALGRVLDDDDVQAVLAGARAHLEPGGSLIVDVPLAGDRPWHQPPYTGQSAPESVWVAGIAAITSERGALDPVTQRCSVLREFELADGRRASARTELQQRSVEQVAASLRAAGFDPLPPTDELGRPLCDESRLAFLRSELSVE